MRIQKVKTLAAGRLLQLRLKLRLPSLTSLIPDSLERLVSNGRPFRALFSHYTGRRLMARLMAGLMDGSAII